MKFRIADFETEKEAREYAKSLAQSGKLVGIPFNEFYGFSDKYLSERQRWNFILRRNTMKIYESMSKKEREIALSAIQIEKAEQNKVIAERLKKCLTILEGNMKAHHMAWKISVGNYLINDPTEIAQYLLMKAGEAS